MGTKVSSEERVARARLISWIFTGIATFFLIVNFFFILTLLQMAGRLQVLVQLFMFTQSSKELVIPDALNEDVAAIDLLNEAMVRQYVTYRHMLIPDPQEMMRRWGIGGELYFLSSWPLYIQFVPNLEEKVGSVSGAVDVDITKVSRIGRNWQVEFDMVTGGRRLPYIASLRLENYPERAVYTYGFNNPLGATVVEYSFYPREKE